MATSNCPGCGTRVTEEQRSCPNCGRSIRKSPGSTSSGDRRRVERSLEPSEFTPKAAPKPNPRPKEPEPKPEPDDEIEIELDEPADPNDSATGSRPPEPARSPEDSGMGTPTYLPEPAQLRDMLAHEPDLLELGLEVYKDKSGKPVGQGFETPVGEIDLLARDSDGTLVVVLVSELGRESELVSLVLQRIGWVQKHLAQGKKSVRGIVLVETPSEALGYAASALGDNVSIVTYRLVLAFHPIQL